MSSSGKIELQIEDPAGRELIQELQATYGWRIVDGDLAQGQTQESQTQDAQAQEGRGTFLLRFAEGRLELLQSGQPSLKPLFIDFLSDRLTWRRRHSLGRSQSIARAVGVPASTAETSWRVVDATAGLGTDAFLLACLGCDVTSIERSPVLAALLADGVRRARADEEMAPLFESRLRFVQADAREWLSALGGDERPDAIYLDPMFPESRKSALPKKGMQVLRELLGHEYESDSLSLLEAALATALDRVVVKRPPQAPPLLRKPTHSYEGKAARFDVYRIAR